MAQAKGSAGQLVIDFETTYGEDPVAPDGILVPFNDFSLIGEVNQIQGQTIRANRNPVEPDKGNTNVHGSAVIPIDQVAFGYWLKALLGAPSTSGVEAPYTHVFEPPAVTSDLPSMVAELGFTDLAQYLKYNGVKVNAMDISFGGDGELVATLDLLGSAETVDSSPYDAAPSSITFARFKNFQGSLEEGGESIATVQKLDLKIGNNLDPEGYCIGDAGIRSSLPDGIMEVSGKLTAQFDSITLYNKAVNDTESSLELVLTSGTYSLTFKVPELKYKPQGIPIKSPAGVLVELPFMGYYSNSADASAIVITLVNGQASYA